VHVPCWPDADRETYRKLVADEPRTASWQGGSPRVTVDGDAQSAMGASEFLQTYGHLLDGPQELGLPQSAARWWAEATSSSIKPLFVAAYVTGAKAFFEADPAGQEGAARPQTVCGLCVCTGGVSLCRRCTRSGAGSSTRTSDPQRLATTRSTAQPTSRSTSSSQNRARGLAWAWMGGRCPFETDDLCHAGAGGRSDGVMMTPSHVAAHAHGHVHMHIHAHARVMHGMCMCMYVCGEGRSRFNSAPCRAVVVSTAACA